MVKTGMKVQMVRQWYGRKTPDGTAEEGRKILKVKIQ